MTPTQTFVVALFGAVFIGLPALGSFIASMVQLARQGAKNEVDTVRHDQSMAATAIVQNTVNGQRDKIMEVVKQSTEATVAATQAVVQSTEVISQNNAVVSPVRLGVDNK